MTESGGSNINEMALSDAGGTGSVVLPLTDSSQLSDDIFKATGEEQGREERQTKPQTKVHSRGCGSRFLTEKVSDLII